MAPRPANPSKSVTGRPRTAENPGPILTVDGGLFEAFLR
jgi:hypothetical protein